MADAQLKSLRALLAETAEQYRLRALPILAVLAVSSLLVLLAAGDLGLLLTVFMGGPSRFLAGMMEGGRYTREMLLLFAVPVATVSSLLVLWSQSAVLAVAVDRELGILAALRQGWRRMWSLGWILLLTGGIVMAGSLLFVPGLVFGVWFLFAGFALYAGDHRGLDALAASRAIVRGHFWNTTGKLLFLWLLFLAMGLVPLAGPVLLFLFFPYCLLFLVAMYRDLELAGAGRCGLRMNRALWGGLAAVGMLLLVLGLVGATVTLVPQWSADMRRLHRQHTRPGPGHMPVPPGGAYRR